MQPFYEALFGFHVFGLGFITSMAFIFGTGVSTAIQTASGLRVVPAGPILALHTPFSAMSSFQPIAHNIVLLALYSTCAARLLSSERV